MRLSSISSLSVAPRSVVVADGVEWALADTTTGPRLVITARDVRPPWLDRVEGEAAENLGARLVVGPTNGRNAAVVREHLPWLKPRPLGVRSSFGFGDRLGLATAGHVRALRAAGGHLAPIFAQQSIREMARSGRTPQEVMDAATWGAFREGWQGDVGADADHLKSAEDIDACLAAGFTLFTIDPGEHVGDVNRQPADLLAAFEALPWPELEDRESDARQRYLGRRVDVEGRAIGFDEATLVRAAVKYARAVLHAARLHRHLATRAASAFELEISVDETSEPTTHAEHVYVATELRRLGVDWVSLAPRFVGRFEKGVDYLGEPSRFEADCGFHAAIARQFGPYKLSIHSGSDKFSIYHAIARQTRGLVHVKTAGTSYLEALRTLAVVEPSLFRDIYVLARTHYDIARASYHVSAEVARTPRPAALVDRELPGLVDEFDTRELLHVTFGSVMTAKAADGSWLLRDRLIAALRRHAEVYAGNVERHLAKHLRPFVRS